MPLPLVLLAIGYGAAVLGFKAATYFSTNKHRKLQKLKELEKEEKQRQKEIKAIREQKNKEVAEVRRRQQAAMNTEAQKQKQLLAVERAIKEATREAAASARREFAAQYGRFREEEKAKQEAEAQKHQEELDKARAEVAQAAREREQVQRELAEAEAAKRAADLRWEEEVQAGGGIVHQKAPEDKINLARQRLGGDWDQSTNIVFCGLSKSGKSTLINSLRGLPLDSGIGAQDNPGGNRAAPVSNVECTLYLNRYSHPEVPFLVFWDAPGMGTNRIVMRTYFDDRTLYIFDRLVIVSTGILHSELQLADFASRLYGIDVAFVLSKGDAGLNSLVRTERRIPGLTEADREAALIEKLIQDHAAALQEQLNRYSDKRCLPPADREAHKRITPFVLSAYNMVDGGQQFQNEEFERWLIAALPANLLPDLQVAAGRAGVALAAPIDRGAAQPHASTDNNTMVPSPGPSPASSGPAALVPSLLGTDLAAPAAVPMHVAGLGWSPSSDAGRDGTCADLDLDLNQCSISALKHVAAQCGVPWESGVEKQVVVQRLQAALQMA